MVTKKTRLLSAIMAVMMLVSLLAGIALPAIAEGADLDLVSITDLIATGKESSDKSYTVADAAELEKLAEALAAKNANVTAKLTADATVYITGNCTFAADYSGAATSLSGLLASLDGDVNNTGKNSEIIGLRFPMKWLGDSACPELRDLTFRDCHATNVNANNSTFLGGSIPVMEDLEFYDCTATRPVYDGTGNGYAFLSIRSGGYASFKDIRMERCKLISAHDPAGGGVNLGFITGRVAGCTMDGIVMIDNEMQLEHWDSSHGILGGEITAASTFKNIFVTGTKIVYDRAATGSLAERTGLLVANLSKHTGSVMDNVIEINNIVTVPAGVEAPMTALVGAVNSTSVSSNLKATNVYSELGVLGTGALTIASGSQAVQVGDDAIEAAILLNQAGVEKKWGLRDGKVDLLAVNEKEITKVTVEIRHPEDPTPLESFTDYTDVDGALINLKDYEDKAAVWTEDPVTGALVGYIIPTHTCEFEYTDNGDGTHSYACGRSWTIAGTSSSTINCDQGGEEACDQDNWKNITDTNTEEPAEKHDVYKACSLCGHVFSEYGYFECQGELKEASRVPATSCKPEDVGAVVLACTKCDYEHTGVLLGDDLHKLDAYVELPNFPQYHEIRCSVCGKETGELEKHVFGAWAETTPPSVDAEGEESRTCVCGKTETRTVAKLSGVELNADKAKVGETFQVKVDLKNNPGVGGFNFKLTYDADVLTLKGSEKGDWDVVFDAAGITGATGVVNKNIHVISGTDMTGDGTVLILDFEVKDDEALLANTETVVAVEVVNAYSHDDYKTTIAFEPYSKTLFVYSGLVKGDMTADKFVNLQDAIYLLRYLNRPAGSTSFEVEGFTITDKIANLTSENDNVDLADGTNTGTVNMSDVIYLLKYLNFQISDAEFFGE